jgi:hypothetical protein
MALKKVSPYTRLYCLPRRAFQSRTVSDGDACASKCELLPESGGLSKRKARAVLLLSRLVPFTTASPPSHAHRRNAFYTTFMKGRPTKTTASCRPWSAGSRISMRSSSNGLKTFASIFEQRLDPAKPAIWLGDLNVAPEPIDVYHPDRASTTSISISTHATASGGPPPEASSNSFSRYHDATDSERLSN